MKPGTTVHVCVPLIQDGAVGRYLDFGLPSQLAEGNLRALSWSSASAYKIFLRERDRRALEESAAFAALRQIVEPTLVLVGEDQIAPGMADAVEIACEAATIGPALEAGAAVGALPAGLVLSDGALAAASGMIAAGASAVLAPRLIVDAEKAGGWAERGRAAGRLSLAPRTLAAEAWPILLARTKGQFWEGSTVDPLPDQLSFAAGPRAAAVLCIRPHTLLCKPERRAAAMGAGSIADLVERACPDISRLRWIEDSDLLLMAEAWRESEGHPMGRFFRSVPALASWIEHILLPRRIAVPPVVRIHDGAAEARDMAAAEREARAVADEFGALLRTPDWYLFGFDQRRLGVRLARRHGVVPAAFRLRAYHPALQGLMAPMAELASAFPATIPALDRGIVDYLTLGAPVGPAEKTAVLAEKFEALWARLREAVT